MSSSNTVKISSSSQVSIDSISYIDNSLVITPGEDSSPPPTISQDGDTWTITLQADRKGSEGVASSFSSQVGGAYHEYAPNGGGTGKSPDQLNFYFGVTINFNLDSGTVPVDVYLAQGNYSLTNNWWIGANGVVNAGTPTLCVLQNNEIVQIFKMSGGTSNFTFSTP